MLAQYRLVEKTKRENGKLVVMRDGKVVRVAAGELTDPLRIVSKTETTWDCPLTVKYHACKAGVVSACKAVVYTEKPTVSPGKTAFHAEKTAAMSAGKSGKAKRFTGRSMKARKK